MTDEKARANAKLLFRGVSCVLLKCFKLPQIASRISRDTLRELITHLLPFFIELRNDKEVLINSVNFITSELIRGADTTNLLAALIRMMHDYVGSVGSGNGNGAAANGSPGSGGGDRAVLENYLELTIKFVWRLVKFFDSHSANLNVDVVLYEAHLFFKSYPREFGAGNSLF